MGLRPEVREANAKAMADLIAKREAKLLLFATWLEKARLFFNKVSREDLLSLMRERKKALLETQESLFEAQNLQNLQNLRDLANEKIQTFEKNSRMLMGLDLSEEQKNTLYLLGVNVYLARNQTRTTKDLGKVGSAVQNIAHVARMTATLPGMDSLAKSPYCQFAQDHEKAGKRQAEISKQRWLELEQRRSWSSNLVAEGQWKGSTH
jgi:hypothetical protein